jgi:predicted O-methyltransferase YrrM
MTLHDKTSDYCARHTSPLDPVLRDLERATHLRTLSPQMLSGAYQGQLLRFVSRMLRPHRILEIGTFTGYATICLAQGLAEGGMLHTVEANDELGGIINQYVAAAGLANAVTLHLGDAAQILPVLEGAFDLVFMDAGKLNYAEHYELALAKTRKGGFLIADNVLWDGKVAGGDERDETARVLRAFNDMVHRDLRVENILLPIRDGLMLMQKI